MRANRRAADTLTYRKDKPTIDKLMDMYTVWLMARKLRIVKATKVYQT